MLRMGRLTSPVHEGIMIDTFGVVVELFMLCRRNTPKAVITSALPILVKIAIASRKNAICLHYPFKGESYLPGVFCNCEMNMSLSIDQTAERFVHLKAVQLESSKVATNSSLALLNSSEGHLCRQVLRDVVHNAMI